VHNVAIVIDSTTSITDEYKKKYNITTVPVNLIIEGRIYLDGIDLQPQEYYPMLKRAKKLPTTSAPPPASFLEAYSKASNESRDVLCVCISSKMSAVYNVARQAAEMAAQSLPDIDVKVFDAHTAAGAAGFIALEAARAAADGGSMKQVIKAAQRVKSKVQMISMLDTLDYLAKGGRISRPAAWFGNLFNIKPILQTKTEEGTASHLDKVRSRKKGIDRLISIMKERVGDSAVHVNVQHADAYDQAAAMKERIASEFNCAELFLTDFTVTMGTHTGPGLLVLAFYMDD